MKTRVPFVAAALACAALAAPPTVRAQSPASPPHVHHDGMAMPANDDAVAPMHAMSAALGPYPMAREASGTAWQPDDSPMDMLHATSGDWMLMLHGFVNGVLDRQSGPRGDRKAFTESMLMGMAQRPLGEGTLGLRAMVSLDPTMGKRGYPLLMQNGESADGRTALIDRQHPHDAVMELSGSFARPLGEGRSAFVYAGLPGEPALGPPTFMHRASGLLDPEAPLGHHWFDSTHVTFGVLTAGLGQGAWKVEGSWFNGREPDERRWNIETRRFDSWSTRLSWNPTASVSTQVSYGDLKSPEQLEPEVRVRRLTASAAWQTTLAGRPWATTVAWGRNEQRGPEGVRRLPAWLLESTWDLSAKQSLFSRFERVEKDELFDHDDPRHGEAFTVHKLSLGYAIEVGRSGPLRWSLGGVLGVMSGPPAIDAAYGRHPTSAMLFLQGRIAP